MSRLRAVETGRTVLVAATSGLSAVIAPDGQRRRRLARVRAVGVRRPGHGPDRPDAGDPAGALDRSAAGYPRGRRRRLGDRPPATREEPVTRCQHRLTRLPRRTPSRRTGPAAAGQRPGRDPDVQRAGEPRADRRPRPRRRARRRRPGRRRQQPRRHRRARRQARRRRRARARPAPAGQGGPGRRLPRRLPLGARPRLRRPRRDGRRRLAPPEDLPRLLAALEDADLVLGSRWVPGGTRRELAQAPAGALPRRQHVRPAGPGRADPGHHRRLPGLPRARRCAGLGLDDVAVAGLLLPGRPRLARRPRRLPGRRGADHVRRARARRPAR